ncbi:MAG: GerW family sporulation protein [Oscillospiraceae bacterium]|jgi:sporulation protein YtfJ|nr:GerW family sporulation protein [Oscillospiraceae bacterium]
MEHPIGDLMSTTMQKIKEMVDVNTIVGAPIRTVEGITIIPVSKVSFGFAAGGSDFTGRNQKPDQENAFGGGSGAGINITPVAFLIVNGESVKLLPVTPPASGTMDRVVEAVPDLLEKVTEFFNKKKEKNGDKEEA